jgi:hypothetical protein
MSNGHELHLSMYHIALSNSADNTVLRATVRHTVEISDFVATDT